MRWESGGDEGRATATQDDISDCRGVLVETFVLVVVDYSDDFAAELRAESVLVDEEEGIGGERVELLDVGCSQELLSWLVDACQTEGVEVLRAQR